MEAGAGEPSVSPSWPQLPRALMESNWPARLPPLSPMPAEPLGPPTQVLPSSRALQTQAVPGSGRGSLLCGVNEPGAWVQSVPVWPPGVLAPHCRTDTGQPLPNMEAC